MYQNKYNFMQRFLFSEVGYLPNTLVSVIAVQPSLNPEFQQPLEKLVSFLIFELFLNFGHFVSEFSLYTLFERNRKKRHILYEKLFIKLYLNDEKKPCRILRSP